MRTRLLGTLASIVVALAGCGPAETTDITSLSGTITIDGSSTVEPISAAVAEEFRKVDAGVRITVGRSGTGGGFQKFCAGETEISDASRPIKPTEVELCSQKQIEYVELPIAYDGLAIVVNTKNTWAQSITTEELKKMWEPEAQGKVMRWSQVRPGWPDRELHLYGAGVDSGTYDYFTEAIVHKEHASRGDYTSSEDDNVIVQGVSQDEGALGFFGLAYYEGNKDKLKLVPVDAGKGPIAPSAATVVDGTYQPLSRPLFIYVSKVALDRPEVAAFIKYYIGNVSQFLSTVGYVPLPEKAYMLAQQRVDTRRTGSLFGGKGSQVGVRIDQLLESEQSDAPK
jgi:phosphate transport system substrate-binding protein